MAQEQGGTQAILGPDRAESDEEKFRSAFVLAGMGDFDVSGAEVVIVVGSWLQPAVQNTMATGLDGNLTSGTEDFHN